MSQKHLFLITLALAATLAVAAIHRATPGPRDQELVGIALGSADGDPRGIILISGRRLACSPGSPRFGDDGAVCRMRLAGRLLEIEAMRNQAPDLDLLSGRCEAIYDGQPHPCRMGNPNLNAHFFAYLPDRLGIGAAEIAAMRWRHALENLGEDVWFASTAGVPLAAAAVAGAATASWSVRRRRRVLISGVSAVIAAAAALALVGAGWLMLTAGLWD